MEAHGRECGSPDEAPLLDCGLPRRNSTNPSRSLSTMGKGIEGYPRVGWDSGGTSAATIGRVQDNHNGSHPTIMDGQRDSQTGRHPNVDKRRHATNLWPNHGTSSEVGKRIATNLRVHDQPTGQHTREHGKRGQTGGDGNGTIERDHPTIGGKGGTIDDLAGESAVSRGERLAFFPQHARISARVPPSGGDHVPTIFSVGGRNGTTD